MSFLLFNYILIILHFFEKNKSNYAKKRKIYLFLRFEKSFFIKIEKGL